LCSALRQPDARRAMGQNASTANFSAEAQKKFHDVAGEVSKKCKCFDRPLTDTQQSVGPRTLSQPYVGGPMSGAAHDIHGDPSWRHHMTTPVRESPYESNNVLQLQQSPHSTSKALMPPHMAYDDFQSTNNMPDIDGRYAGVDTDYDGSQRASPPPPSGQGLTCGGEAAAAHNRACRPEASLTSPCPPSRTNSNSWINLSEGAMQRGDWVAGSIIEVFSASGNNWHVAFVVKVQPAKGDDMLMVQYWVDDEPKNKCLLRSDDQMQMLGTSTGDLPPGFRVKSSQSRPGQHVFMDATTGIKYATAEIAWQSHFERLMKTPAGMETISQVSDFKAVGSKSAVPTGPAAASTVPPAAAVSPQVAALAAGLVTEYAEDAQQESATAPASAQCPARAQLGAYPPVPSSQNSLGPPLTPAARPQAAASHQTVPPSRSDMGPAIMPTKQHPGDRQTVPATGMGPVISPPRKQTGAHHTVPVSQSGMGPAVTPSPQKTGVHQTAPLSQGGMGPAITVPPKQTGHQTLPLSRAGMGPAITPPPKQGSASVVAHVPYVGHPQSHAYQNVPVSQSAMGPAITPAAQGANFKQAMSGGPYIAQAGA